MYIVAQGFTVICVDNVGSERWIFRTQGTGVVDEAVHSIVYGLDGNLYATGYSYLLDFAIISIDTAGTQRWKYLKGQAGLNDRALDGVYGSDGNIYSVGFLESNSTGYDFTVIGLDTTGTESWVYRYNGSGSGSDKAFSITYGLDHNLYIAGCSYDSMTGLDFTVISLDTTTSHVGEDKAIPTDNNDFGGTIFSGPLILPEGKNCKIFDVTGRVVLPDKMRPGIYFVEIDGKITQKVVKVR
jgi:hypothetical protein